MQAKRHRLTKLGLVCSSAAFLMVSGCSIWQEKGPERYGLAPGPKRIPAMNPGGTMAQLPASQTQQQPSAVGQRQQATVHPPMAAPASVAPMMAPPVAYAPSPPPITAAQPFVVPPPAASAPSAMTLPPQAAGYANAEPMQAMMPAPVAPQPAYVQEPFDLAATSLDRNVGYPSLSQVPQAPVQSADRVTNAKNAANALQQELHQSEAQRFAATQQATYDGTPWAQAPQQQPMQAPAPMISPPPAGYSTATPSMMPSPAGTMSLDDIDRRFAGPRAPQESLTTLQPATNYQVQPPLQASVQNQSQIQAPVAAPFPPKAPLQMPPSLSIAPTDDMTAIAQSYEFPAPNAPDATFRITEPSPVPAAPTAELPPIKLVPPADLDEGAIALDVPPVRERFVPEPPAMEVPAAEEIFVPSAPTVAAAPNGWDEYSVAPSAQSDAIVLTPPPEMFTGRAQGFLPDSRYEKRRRFQRRKIRF